MLRTLEQLVLLDHWDLLDSKDFPVQLHGQVQQEILGPRVKVIPVIQVKLEILDRQE